MLLHLQIYDLESASVCWNDQFDGQHRVELGYMGSPSSNRDVISHNHDSLNLKVLATLVINIHHPVSPMYLYPRCSDGVA